MAKKPDEIASPRNCDEMKIGQFKKIICDKLPRPEHWVDIFDEYLLKTKGNGSNPILDLHKLAQMYRNMFVIIDKMCEIAAIDQNTEGYIEFNDALRSLTRIRGKGKMDRDELQRHMNVRTSYRQKWTDKEDEIKLLEVKTDGDSEKSWNEQISLLGKYQGYRLNQDEVSVSEYISILNNFKQDNKPKVEKKYNSR